MAMRLHELVSVSGRAESAREALEFDIPPVNRAYEQMVYFRSLNKSLVALLAGDICANPYFYSRASSAHNASSANMTPGVLQLRRVRASIARLLMLHSKTLADPRDSQSAPGYNRLIVYWLAHSAINICLDRLRDTDLPYIDETSLARNQLLISGGSCDDIQYFSLDELRRAIDIFRDRLCMLDDADAAVFRYAGLLELRAATFSLHLITDKTDYDVPTLLIRGEFAVNRGYNATMAWYFVWIKRYLYNFISLSSSRAFRTNALPGRIYDARRRSHDGQCSFTSRREALLDFIRVYAAKMNSDEHHHDFIKLGTQYNASPGDLDAHSHVHGMGGIERARVRDVVSMRRTPEADQYMSTRKFQRDLIHWVISFEMRNKYAGIGRFVGGGASCEAFIEQIAILHIVKAFFISRKKVAFDLDFVITCRLAGEKFLLRVEEGLHYGLPFIIQRLGRFACCVPRLPCPGDRELIEARLGIAGNAANGGEDEAAVLYDCDDCVDALVIWCTFLLEGWDGEIKRSALKLKPALQGMLGQQAEQLQVAEEDANMENVYMVKV